MKANLADILGHKHAAIELFYKKNFLRKLLLDVRHPISTQRKVISLTGMKGRAMCKVPFCFVLISDRFHKNMKQSMKAIGSANCMSKPKQICYYYY